MKSELRIKWRGWVGLILIVAISACGGCASGPNKADPWEKTNRSLYNFNEGLDRVALKPAADVYVKIIPKPVRTGLGNGFDNLTYFNVILNDLLQGNFGQGLGDTGRMAVNSTVGIGGIFDVATPWGLPPHENDFGITLGKWGSEPGPYLVLPLYGASSLRDAPGLGVEYLATPTTYLCLPLGITAPLYTVDTIDARARGDIAVRFRNAAAIDPYVFTRDAYLQYRYNRIHEGKAASQPSFYDEDEDVGPAVGPASGAAVTRPGM